MQVFLWKMPNTYVNRGKRSGESELLRHFKKQWSCDLPCETACFIPYDDDDENEPACVFFRPIDAEGVDYAILKGFEICQPLLMETLSQTIAQCCVDEKNDEHNMWTFTEIYFTLYKNQYEKRYQKYKWDMDYRSLMMTGVQSFVPNPDDERQQDNIYDAEEGETSGGLERQEGTSGGGQFTDSCWQGIYPF